jgi:hypothetical protein
MIWGTKCANEGDSQVFADTGLCAEDTADIGISDVRDCPDIKSTNIRSSDTTAAGHDAEARYARATDIGNSIIKNSDLTE